MVLTFDTGLLFLGQWHNTCEVTNHTERTIQKPYFSHDSFRNFAKMKQAGQDAVGLCEI
jgi:hypothetical protein